MTMTPPTAPPTTGPMIASGPPTFVVGVACTVIVDCIIEVGVVIRRTGIIGDVDDNTLVVRGNGDERALRSEKCNKLLLEYCTNCSWPCDV